MLMRRYTILLLALLSTILPLHAQTATDILDQSAAALKAAGDARIDFTANMDGSSGKGYIKLQGKKFVLNLGGMITWFDGKTMWSYVVKNEEVTVTEPTAAQIAKINPYSFLQFYKKGYKTSMGKSTPKEHEVILQSDGAGQYKKVVIRVNRKTHYPVSLSMTTNADTQVTVHCNSVKGHQKFTASTFTFNPKRYPKAEVVDLR